ILMLIFFLYRFKLQKKQLNSIEQLTFIFLFSGGLCSLIDKLFWGGSLDFLHIHNLFIADIKDIFITFGLGSFVLSNIISDDQIELKDFFNFILKSLKIK
ncbi:MAG TPA: signal peptidase II, partial [Candidatus Dwaynia gallinarum]|nr:signal peptidase II [Candidatus Dwaynia gallinarum]